MTDILNHKDLELVVAELGTEVFLDSDTIRDTLYSIIHREIQNKQLQSAASGVDILEAIGVVAEDYAEEIRARDRQEEEDERVLDRNLIRMRRPPRE